MMFPGGGMDMVEPRGENNPVRDLHTAALFSKIGAFANIAQVFQNQRTNQLLGFQIFQQGMSGIKSQISDLAKQIQTYAEETLQAHKHIKDLCFSNAKTQSDYDKLFKQRESDPYRNSILIMTHFADAIEELDKKGGECGAYFGHLLDALSNIDSPEDFERFNEMLANNSEVIEKYWVVYKLIAIRLSLTMKLDEVHIKVTQYYEENDDLIEKWKSICQRNQKLESHFAGEIEEFEDLIFNHVNILSEEFYMIHQEIDQNWYKGFDDEFFANAFETADKFEEVFSKSTTLLRSIMERATQLLDQTFTSESVQREDDIETKLQNLSNLLEKGLISKSEYSKKRKSILDSI